MINSIPIRNFIEQHVIMILPLLHVLITVHMAHGTMEGFVIQGNKTHIRHYPHSVYLNIICTRITYICGGSILNQRVVLTAGHCLEDCTGKYRDEVYLKYGHENPSQMGSTQMKRFIMHERYDGNSLDNDIALVSGKRNIPLGKTVRRIAIFRSPPRQRLAYMAGWGVMNVSLNSFSYQ